MDLDVHLGAIARGDAAAFGRWLASAEAPIRASLRSFATRVDVEAALQEALLRVWQVAPRHTPDGAPNSLLRLGVRIAKNLCIDEVRRRQPALLDDDAMEAAIAAQAPSPAGPDPLLRKVIIECRDALPNKPREVLDARLASAGSEPDEAIAARLNMRPNTFLQNFTRARRLLAECLGKRRIDVPSESASP